MAYTVITGASRGLGRALAQENARRGRDLILISLAGEGLKNLAEEIKKQYNVNVVFFEADLTKTDELKQVCRKIIDSYPIDTLINNAGIGGTYKFLEVSEDYLNTIIDLNVRATVMMTYYLLPQLLRQPRAYILNIASLAALNPLPFKTIYPASKAFIDFFSRSLAIELRNTNVKVSVAYPGTMPTNKHVIRQIDSHKKSIRLFVMSPEKVARIFMKKLLRGKKQIIPGFFNKFTWLLIKLVPYNIRLAYLRHTYAKELNANKETNYGKSTGNRSQRISGSQYSMATQPERL